MTHLRIEQNNGVIEEVSSSVITKLYEIAHAGLDVSSNLLGRLHVSKAYGDLIDWLTTHYQNLYITADNRYIRFEDDNTLRFFLTGIGDGIGITEQDMSTVTKSMFTFKNNTTLTNLNNFKYCTGITDILDPDGMFSGMSNLEQITLPATITQLPNSCFKGDTNLLSITIPSSITTIFGLCFNGCSSLTTINGSENITSICGWGTFCECTSVTEFNFPNLTLLAPGNGETPEKHTNVFRGCTSLERVILGDCYSLGNRWASYDERRPHFINCTSLHTVDVKSLTYIPDGGGTTTFRNCPAMRNFIIRSSTVPIVEDNGTANMNSFGGSNVKIYVPDDAVNTYKSAAGWSNIASYVYALSEYLS